MVWSGVDVTILTILGVLIVTIDQGHDGGP